MATFSPSPAPRLRVQNRGNTPIKRSHRLVATPSFTTNDANSTSSAMDVDERASTITDRSLSRMGGDILFAKTDEMSVVFYASLPLEVKQILRVSDFKVDPYSGEIDIDTGFALVTSVQTCFVWQHAQALKGVPTCYIFACPQDTSLRPPLHALVPQGSREPGLILVSVGGKIRFWESIGIGLAGGDNFTASMLEDMEYDEEVTNLVRADAHTYILSTSYGRLYRLVLCSSGGKYHLICRGFSRTGSTNSLSRLIPSFFLGTDFAYDFKDKNNHIHAVALGVLSSNGDCQVWALANGRVQLWNMKSEGWEHLVLDHDLVDILSGEVAKRFDVGDRDPKQDLELSDLAVFSDGNVAILLSYSGKEVSDDFRRLYALAELRSFADGSFSTVRLESVPYQTTSQPGPPVHPRIQLIYGGSIISVQFGDAVAFCARDSEYRDRLELKSPNDRTLGVGVNLSTNLLLILTATNMMKVSQDLDKIKGFRPEIGRTNLVKSIMMQAILYGASPVNPLRFSFPPDLNEEALMQAAEQLSSAVLKSDPEVVQQSPDTTAQLTRRKERLSWLIGFINENVVLGKMSQESRQRLATDAEKLYASHQLWLSHNQFLSTLPSRSVLKDAIVAFMEEIEDASHEDVARAFFRYHVGDIGRLLKKVVDTVSAVAKLAIGNVQTLLPEANRVVVIVLKSAFQYRAYNVRVYGIVPPMIKAWTSRPSVIDAVLSLFDLTTKAVESSGALGRARDREPGFQLPALAAVLLESIKERLLWLSSTGEERRHDADILNQRFSVLRPEILETLRRCGYEEAGFELAEKYQDFASLVNLCHRETVYPPAENPHYRRIQAYIEKFKEDFTSELFLWYIQHAEVRTMFEQEASYAGYMDAFFSERPNSAISWIHDLGQGRYGSAGHALLKDADIATNLEGKHLMLSIGKLSHLVHMEEANVAEDSILDAFHDGLDFVSVHESLLQDLRLCLVATRARQSLDAQLDTILKAKGAKIVSKAAFTHIFKDLLRQLLQGKTLPVEDIIDLLTLQDNAVEDFATSLHLLRNTKNLPEGRRLSVLRTVWRRVYLHDDWETLQKTADVSDDELNLRYQGTALYLTLCTVLERDDGPIVEPSEALMIPSIDEIMSRRPGMSPEQVESLICDYNSEQDRLGELELEEIFLRVHELAMNGVEEVDD